MAKAPATEITFPIARLVQGSLTEPNTKDADGNPLLVKNGPDKGQPRLDYFFAFAIPKTAGVPWWQEPWGQLMYSVGLAAFGQQVCANPQFAWKIKDGDSQNPNTKGKKPCDQEGFPGHWVIQTSSGYPPTVYNANGSSQLADPKIVKPGHYIQVAASISSNESNTKPGIYVNHSMVAHSGYGTEIQVTRDATKAGFGQGPAPAGMSATPLQQAQFPGATMPGGATPGAPMAGPGMMPGAPMAGPGPGAPMAGPGMGAPGGMAPGMPGMAAPQIAVTPNPAAMAAPGAGFPAPGAAPAAPTAPRDMNARRMGDAITQNWDINAMLTSGWKEADLIARGYVTPY